MLNRESLRARLGELDDASLKALILAVASAAGASKKQIEPLVRDIPTLRSLLGRMTDEQFKELIGGLGSDKTDALLKKFGADKG